MRRSVVMFVAFAVVAAGCTASPSASSPLAAALAAAPVDAVEVSFTDWSRVDDDDLAAAVRAGLADDTLTRSAIAPLAVQWEEVFGFSPQDLDWEAGSLTESGSSLAVGWSSSFGSGRIADALEAAGYERDGERWRLGDDAPLPAGLAASMMVAEIDESSRTLRAGSDDGALDGGLSTRRAVRDVVVAVSEAPAAMLLQRGDRACATAGVSGRGGQVAEQGKAAAERAGGLSEPTWGVRAVGERSFTVVLGFDSPGLATDQARVRERLTTGAFIGRSGAVTDVVTDADVTAEENVTRLSFTRRPGGPSLMDSTGPILFAGC
ncbi:hypothetical protein BHE97_16795 [Aeromicrobium sp. PE09-221]|nr:hypothetical protein BHE97_16795 [Aeromicrobium sp. PE09-221]